MKFKLIVDKDKDEEVVVTAHEPSAFTQRIESMVLEYTGGHEITAYREDTLIRLRFDRIECITVIEGKTYAIADGSQYRLKQRLYELETIVPSSFIRINKSTLANEAQLERFVATYSGGVNARFVSGYEEYVSRRCFAAIKRRYNVK